MTASPILRNASLNVVRTCYALSLLSYGVRENIKSMDWSIATAEDLFKTFITKRPHTKFLLDLPVVSELNGEANHQIILRSYDSGLDILCYVGSRQVIVAADGTDPLSSQRGELWGDLRDGLRIAFGRQPDQLRDLINFYSEVSDLCHNRTVYAAGHSLGGHLQGLALWECGVDISKVVMFNAPGYSRAVLRNRAFDERANRIISLSAIEPIALIGRHLGSRVWVRSCYSHSLPRLHKYIERSLV